MTTYRHLILMLMATLGLMLAATPGRAQQPDVGDQPGLLPDDSVELDPEFQKQVVYYRTTEAPGTIIISTTERHLYLVQPGGRAIRYGIGVGRDGFQWQGLLNITKKAEWPDWTPPPEMIARQPYLPRFMAGGPGNPLGARAHVSRHHGLPHPRHQPARHDRHRGVVGLLPPGQCRRRRSLRPRPRRHQGDRAAEAANCNRARRCLLRASFFPIHWREIISCAHFEAAC